MRNLSIGLRAILVFLFFLLVIIFISLVGLNNQKNMNNQMMLIEENYMPAVIQLGFMRNHLNQIKILTRENFIDAFSSRPIRHTSNLEQEYRELYQVEKTLSALITEGNTQQVYNRYISSREKFTEGATNVYKMLLDNKIKEAATYAVKFAEPNANESLKEVYNLFDLAESGLKESSNKANTIYMQGVYTSVILLIAILLISILVALVFIRSLTQPLNYAVQIAQAIANNDLTQKVKITGKDEATKMLSALKTMQENLAEKVSAIINSSTQLAASAEQLSVVTNQTSEGVQNQRSETEQLATAMNQMTATVNEIAQNSEQAAAATRAATQQAQEGEQHLNDSLVKITALAQEVEKAGEAIEKLNQDSQEISTVLVVINDIADQTNLLALNAAIEAARAGEAGRGFAVVADEVRNLASRTQESTQQIESLIGNLQTGSKNAVDQMQASRSLAGETADIAEGISQELQAVTQAIQHIQDMSSQIATAAEEQSSVAEEINLSIIRVNDVADQSAAAVEQTSASANELARLGQELQSLVSQYKV